MATSTTEDYRQLFADEATCDAALHIGASKERLPVHTKVLRSNSEYFRESLRSVNEQPQSSAHGKQILNLMFPDESPKAFRSYIRWLYGCGCSLASVSAALDILEVANKYSCNDLALHAIQYLHRNVDQHNLLQFLNWGMIYVRTHKPQPSAPPLEDEEDDDPPPPYSDVPPSYEAACSPSLTLSHTEGSRGEGRNDSAQTCERTVQSWFYLLDTEAERVLSSESFEEARIELVAAVLIRDTLGVSTEESVLKALLAWVDAQCSRRQMELTVDNRRRLLEPRMRLLPRLLTTPLIPKETLMKLYTPEEVNFIMTYKSNSAATPPPDFVNNLESLSRPRTGPVPLESSKEPKNKQQSCRSPINGKKKKVTGKKVKQFFWDVFCFFIHMID